MNYKIIIDGIDYTNYVSLPIDINKFRVDSVYLQGSLYLSNTKKAEKFHQDDLVEIYIDNEEIDYKIAGDTITSVMNSFDNSFLYSHSLTLVELIKDTDQYLLSDFSFSINDQEILSVNKESLKSNNVQFYNSYVLGATDLSELQNSFIENTLITQQPGYFSGQIVTTINKDAAPNYNISVSFNNISGLCYSFNTSIPFYGKSWSYFILQPVYFRVSYKLKTDTEFKTLKDEYIYSPDFKKAEDSKKYRIFNKLLEEYDDNIEPNLNFSFNLPKLDNGLYEFKIQQVADNLNDPEVRAFVKYIILGNPGASSITEGDIDRGLDKLYSDINNNPWTLTFEIEYRDVPESKTKTISDVLNKAFKVVKQPIIKSDIEQTTIFKLDESKESYGVLSSTPTPEFIFQKNNLYEVLKDIGRVMNGIPRLTKDNKIYYTLLDSVSDNENFDNNTNELSKKSSNLENYASYISSNISNMVSLNEIHYPYKDGWVKYSASSIDDSLIYPDNAALRIDSEKNGGIYRVKEVNVRNYSKKTSNIVHLIQYSNNVEIFSRVITKDLWDNYSVDNNAKDDNGKPISKAHYLYYEKGNNKIVMNELTSEQRVKIFGSDIKKFIYKIAINDAYLYEYGTNIGDDDWNNLEDIEFQIVYIPYINTLYNIEKQNISGIKNQYRTLYSQDSNNPSEDLLSSTVSNYLKRLGNDDIEKTTYLTDSSLIPYPGEFLDLNNDRYYCDQLSVSLNSNYIKCIMNYTKDYNKINRLVGNPKDYKQYLIPKAESVRRYINFNKYFYLRETDKIEALDKIYNPSFDLYIFTLLLNNTNIDGSLINLSKDSNTLFYIPSKKYYTENGVKYQTDFYDNYAITSKRGDKVSTSEQNITTIYQAVSEALFSITNAYESEKFKNDYISYVNNYGECSYLDTRYIKDPGSLITNYPAVESPTSDKLDETTLAQYIINPDKDVKEALSFILNIDFITDVPGLDISNLQYLLENKIEEIDPTWSNRPYELCVFNKNSNFTKVLTSITTTVLKKLVVPYALRFNLSTPGIYSPIYADGWLLKRGNTILFKKEMKIEPGVKYENKDLYLYSTTEKVKTYKEN
nr:MAG TPA: hypothetical protein [Caudoviricetes sp.]